MPLAIPLALSHLPFQLSPLTPSLPLPIPFLPLPSQPLPASPDQAPVAPQKGDPPEAGREAGEDVTPITPPEDLILKPLLLIPNMDFSSSNPSWSGFSKYLCPDGPLDLSTRPRFTNYSSGGALVNPFLKSNLSQPKVFSPMVTFNEPSKHVRDMFSLVHSCDFLPGGDHKHTLSIHIKK